MVLVPDQNEMFLVPISVVVLTLGGAMSVGTNQELAMASDLRENES